MILSVPISSAPETYQGHIIETLSFKKILICGFSCLFNIVDIFEHLQLQYLKKNQEDKSCVISCVSVD